jgi:hypothetical protein
MLGQVNASLPIFAGFKIKTALKPTITCIRQRAPCKPKEEVAMMVVNYYASLKHKKNRRTFKRKSKSAQQRVTDFLLEKRNYSKK